MRRLDLHLGVELVLVGAVDVDLGVHEEVVVGLPAGARADVLEAVEDLVVLRRLLDRTPFVSRPGKRAERKGAGT